MQKSFENMKCVWMKYSMVEYKLCDMNFECENCPFDKVMRNLSSKKDAMDSSTNFSVNKSIIDVLVNKISEEKYSDKFIYLKNHFIIKYLFSNTYYLGLSHAVLNLLDNIVTVKNCTRSNHVVKDQQVLKITGSWGSVIINAPMNFLILDRINFSPDELIKNKWFAIISPDSSEISAAQITREEWEKDKFNFIKLLKSYKEVLPDVGQAMRDGGAEIKFLYQFIGKYEYQNLVNQIF